VFLFSPYDSILKSNYSMKSETVSTEKTENSFLIKIRYSPTLKKKQGRGLLHLGDLSNCRDHNWAGGNGHLQTDQDPASETSTGNRTGHGLSA